MNKPYQRAHHRRIASLLNMMDADFLESNQCYFGGGTAIALQLEEYRESVDVDILCSSRQGYLLLRERIFNEGIQGIFKQNVELARAARSDQYGVRAICIIENSPIKLEIINENRISLSGVTKPGIPILCVSRIDSFAEKLLANTDRGADRSTMNRDMIDLMAMCIYWGDIPNQSWQKAKDAYGTSVAVAFQRVVDKLASDENYANNCLLNLGINEQFGNKIKEHITRLAQSHQLENVYLPNQK